MTEVSNGSEKLCPNKTQRSLSDVKRMEMGCCKTA